MGWPAHDPEAYDDLLQAAMAEWLAELWEVVYNTKLNSDDWDVLDGLLELCRNSVSTVWLALGEAIPIIFVDDQMADYEGSKIDAVMAAKESFRG